MEFDVQLHLTSFFLKEELSKYNIMNLEKKEPTHTSNPVHDQPIFNIFSSAIFVPLQGVSQSRLAYTIFRIDDRSQKVDVWMELSLMM